MSSRFSRYNKTAPWSNYLGFLYLHILLFVCLFVSLDTFIFVMFLVPRDSLMHWGFIYVQQVFSIQQDSTLVGWIFVLGLFPCLYLLVCLFVQTAWCAPVHRMSIMPRDYLVHWGSKQVCYLYVQQVFSTHQDTLWSIFFPLSVYFCLFVCMCFVCLCGLTYEW